MKAAVCRQFGAPLSIEDVTLAPPADKAIKIAVGASAICHSDITYKDGGWGGNLPILLGHEAAGTIIETGAAVEGFKPGDRVVITLMRSCGSCPSCGRELEAVCESPPGIGTGLLTDHDGHTVTPLMNSGTFAEEVLVHERQCIAIPDEMNFDTAALLGCGVITGFGAVLRVGKVQPGERVAVVGIGGVGVNALQATHIAGAGEIHAIDTDNSKRELALAVGATAFCNPLESTPEGGYDAAFVAVGSARVIENAIRLIRPGGRVVILGMPSDADLVSINMSDFAGEAKSVIGTKMGSAMIREDIPQLIKWYQEGRIDLDRLISHRFPFEEINTALETARNPGSMRVVLNF